MSPAAPHAGIAQALVAGIARALVAGAALLGAATLHAQAPAEPTAATRTAATSWQACAAMQSNEARLACFDRWAGLQTPPAPTPAPPAAPAVPPALASNQPAPDQPQPMPPEPVNAALPATRIITAGEGDGCHDRQYSELSRFWELEAGTDCHTFGIRGYRPLSLSLIASDSVNRQPSSDNPLNNVATPTDYQRNEVRIQLSVRTKIAQGLLTDQDPTRRDSLWFGYTQQSYWQLFNGAISRPFRSTDHEPEFIYVYPFDAALPGGWRLRYGGAGLVHQSNGQSLPLSRSWNRVYLMGGMEHGNAWRIQGRVWQRLHENASDDDNPGISDYIGRAELSAYWNVNAVNTLGATLRHSLKADARGSWRLEWLRALGTSASGLRFHAQLFSGYGDSLLDFNRRRTVLSVGLSLVDF